MGQQELKKISELPRGIKKQYQGSHCLLLDPVYNSDYDLKESATVYLICQDIEGLNISAIGAAVVVNGQILYHQNAYDLYFILVNEAEILPEQETEDIENDDGLSEITDDTGLMENTETTVGDTGDMETGEFIFNEKLKAEKNTDSLYLDQLYRNPMQYADGNIYRLSGIVKSINKSETYTSGLITVNEMDESNERLINFEYYGWLDCVEGDLVSFYGYITPNVATYTLNYQDGRSKEIQTANIQIDYYTYGERTVLDLTDYEWDFVCGSYALDEEPGQYVTLTKTTFGATPYEIESITQGVSAISSGNTRSEYIKIMMRIEEKSRTFRVYLDGDASYFYTVGEGIGQFERVPLTKIYQSDEELQGKDQSNIRNLEGNGFDFGLMDVVNMGYRFNENDTLMEIRRDSETGPIYIIFFDHYDNEIWKGEISSHVLEDSGNLRLYFNGKDLAADKEEALYIEWKATEGPNWPYVQCDSDNLEISGLYSLDHFIN